jgi:putative transposase
VFAVKSIWQNYCCPEGVPELMDVFGKMVNHSIQTGLTNNASSLKKLCLLSYRGLREYQCPSYYKLCAISRAAGILAARKKSLRRGYRSKTPYAAKPHLSCCYGFKIEGNLLSIPRGGRTYWNIRLNNHTLSALSEPGLRVRSFTLTAHTVSLCISKEIPEMECKDTTGIDRNLRNLTCGNETRIARYDLSKTVEIASTTRNIIASFKRTDDRIRRSITSKYGRRRRDRTVQILHEVTKQVVSQAVRDKNAIVLEDIRSIRGLYQKGNGQGNRVRGMMNGWSYGQVQRQLEYKARWAGLPIIHLSLRDTRGSSVTCPRCGERLQSDKHHTRQLWCQNCKVWTDRDEIAAINLSRRGRLRFDRSKGEAVEAMKGNPTPTVIPGVDAPKLTYPTIS